MSKRYEKTAFELLELAEEATTKEDALKYAKQALAIEPENIDAQVIVAEITADSSLEMLEKYKKLIESNTEQMKKEGYMDEDSIGDFWLILETRPYMRLRHAYFQLLVDCGMMKKAAEEGLEIIRLNTNDNLGVRHSLMHIFSCLEDEKSALELQSKYSEHEETQILLPLSILYFKLNEFEKAKEYLSRLAETNPDTKKFIRCIVRDKLEQYVGQMSPYGYRPCCIEELIAALLENTYLYENVSCYFEWAKNNL